MLKGLVIGVLLLLTMGEGNAHNRPRDNVTSNSWSTGFNWSVQPTIRHSNSTARNRRLSRRRQLSTRRTTVPVLTAGSGDLVTVPTAAGIPITVERKLVPNFQGFVDDLVKIGYTPKHIGCWAPVGTHVSNSNHYHGGACDFDQTGWGRTSPTMYHVSALAEKWGLRDGCSFRRPDCGHVDDGSNIGWKHPNNLIARYVEFQTTPVIRQSLRIQQTQAPIDNFEE
jgi:hypothetical protein